MSTHSLDLLERLFQEALHRPRDERAAFLASACEGNDLLRRELETLLHADAAAEREDFLGGFRGFRDVVFGAAAGPAADDKSGGGASGGAAFGADAMAGADAASARGAAKGNDGMIAADEAHGGDSGASALSGNDVPELGDEMVGQYRIVERLGGGGMGSVYKAVDVVLGRTVALKFLADHLGSQANARERFLQEARAASVLDHPNIATIFEIGEFDGRLFIAMACCEGQSLDAKIAHGPLPIVEALSYAIQIAEGLSAAHKAGIVHRDVKPANVMVDDREHVRLLDFGVAKVADVDLTKAGMLLGTVLYMSPEQASGANVDHRSDVWSLGVVLYEMLSGVQPFRGDFEQAVLYAIQHADPKPLRKHRAGIPAALDRAVRRALSRAPSRRYQTVREFAQMLRSILRTIETQDASVERRDVRASIPQNIVAVGRDDEVEELTHHLDQALAGQRRTIFVTGEAGSGKTTLINFFVSEVRQTFDVAVGRGQCFEHRGPGEAYLPVLEALRRLCRDEDGFDLVDCLEQHAPTWLAQMPGLVAADREEALQARVRGVTRERMLREIVEALDEFVATRPLILVLEDLHWCDLSTLDFVAWITRRTDPARLMVLATYRPARTVDSTDSVHTVIRDLLLRGPAFEIALPLLDVKSVAELLGRRFPDAEVPPSFVRLVHGRTEGHPLYLTSLIDYWVANKKITIADGTLSMAADPERLRCDVPASLRHLIEQRFTGLTPAEQVLLDAASVVGSIFSAASVSAGSDIPHEQVEMTLSALTDRGELIRSDGVDEWPDGTVSERYAFAHKIYQEALYDRIPAGRKVRMHRAIGERLEAAFGAEARHHAARLAMHFVEGRDWRRAVAYLRTAAETAFHRSAHQDAVEHLQLALETLGRLPEDDERRRLEIILQSALGSALVMIEGWSSPQAEAAYVRARALSEREEGCPHIIPVLYGLAILKEFQGEYATTQGILEQLFDVSGESEGLIIESHELMACSTFHQGEFKASLEFAEAGLSLSVGSTHVPDGMLGEDPEIGCLGWAGMSLWFLGYPEQALAHVVSGVEHARTAERSFALADALMRAAFVATWRKEPDRVIRYADPSVELAGKQGFRYRVGVGKVLRGWARSLSGDIGAGIAEIQAGIEMHASTGANMDRPFLLGLLAEACSFGRAWDAGLGHVDDAIALVEKGRSFFFEPELHRIRGHLLLGADGHRDDVEAAFQRALSVARSRHARSLQLRTSLSLASLWSEEGNHRQGIELVRDVFDAFTEGFDTPDLVEAKAILSTPA